MIQMNSNAPGFLPDLPDSARIISGKGRIAIIGMVPEVWIVLGEFEDAPDTIHSCVRIDLCPDVVLEPESAMPVCIGKARSALLRVGCGVFGICSATSNFIVGVLTWLIPVAWTVGFWYLIAFKAVPYVWNVIF